LSGACTARVTPEIPIAEAQPLFAAAGAAVHKKFEHEDPVTVAMRVLCTACATTVVIGVLVPWQ
jgi:hypothetical protein